MVTDVHGRVRKSHEGTAHRGRGRPDNDRDHERARGQLLRLAAMAQSGRINACSAHGLRKAAARRLADAGCSTHEIASITGHATLAEVSRYTKAADQQRLARSALGKLSASLGTPHERTT
jgi:integrase